MKHDDCTVYVRGLPTDVVRVELEELFSGIGPVKKVGGKVWRTINLIYSFGPVDPWTGGLGNITSILL
jgi:RNA recognition motif-containing protein